MQRMTTCFGSSLALILGSLLAIPSQAATTPVYVDDNWTGSTNCGGYTWGVNAFSTIQEGVNNVSKGGIVWVNDGVYNKGGKKWGGTSNRVAMTQKMTLQSVNGPLTTIIEGVADPVSTNGDLAMRCVYMTNKAILVGFTLRNGHTEIDTSAIDIKHAGGGVFMDQGGTVSNCIIQGNTAYKSGGGIFADGPGMVYNCLITDNQVGFKGGGVHIEHGGGVINNSTIAFNSAGVDGGGMDIYWGGDARNCVIYYNTSPASPNWSVSGVGSFNNCDTIPLTGISGSGNIDAEPMFVDDINGDFRLLAPSPCVNRGLYQSWMTNVTDLAGNTRVYGSTVDIGAYEMVDPAVFVDDDWTGPTNCGGRTWGVDAFSVIQTAVDAAPSNSTVWVYDGFYNQGGAYMYGSNRVVLAKPITLQSVYGPANTLIVGQPDPITTNGPGAFRGVYMTNGAVLAGFTVTNGYTSTAIFSTKVSFGGGIFCHGGGAVSNTVVTGCTIVGGQGGGIYSDGGLVTDCVLCENRILQPWLPISMGGGVHCQNGIVQNCLVRGNLASTGGGIGLTGSSALECLVTSNSAALGGGIAYYGVATVDSCQITANSIVSGGSGGGIYGSVTGGGALNLLNCTITRNKINGGTGNGLKLSGGVIRNCLIAANEGGSSSIYGNNETVIVNNSTVVDNTGNGIDLYYSTISNCISVNNTGQNIVDYSGHGSTVSHTCASPILPGTGNINADPLFVDAVNGDYRLQSTSPCVDAGTNQSWMVYDYDLDGNPRLIDGNGDQTATVDMGAYEFLPTP